MKARIKETGEPIEDLIIYDSTGNQWPLDDVEFIPYAHSPKEIDWEHRRFELVKAAMQGFISTERFSGDGDDVIARMSVTLANVVLSYMKGGNE